MGPLSWGLLLLLVVILVSILGAVETPSRLLFVGGIAVVILAHLVPGAESLGMAAAVVGILIAASATVPLLRRPA